MPRPQGGSGQPLDERGRSRTGGDRGGFPKSLRRKRFHRRGRQPQGSAGGGRKKAGRKTRGRVPRTRWGPACNQHRGYWFHSSSPAGRRPPVRGQNHDRHPSGSGGFHGQRRNSRPHRRVRRLHRAGELRGRHPDRGHRAAGAEIRSRQARAEGPAHVRTALPCGARRCPVFHHAAVLRTAVSPPRFRPDDLLDAGIIRPRGEIPEHDHLPAPAGHHDPVRRHHHPHLPRVAGQHGKRPAPPHRAIRPPSLQALPLRITHHGHRLPQLASRLPRRSGTSASTRRSGLSSPICWAWSVLRSGFRF